MPPVNTVCWPQTLSVGANRITGTSAPKSEVLCRLAYYGFTSHLSASMVLVSSDKKGNFTLDLTVKEHPTPGNQNAQRTTLFCIIVFADEDSYSQEYGNPVDNVFTQI